MINMSDLSTRAICLTTWFMIVCRVSGFSEYSSLGCWKLDQEEETNAMPDLQDDLLRSRYPTNYITSSVARCARFAKYHGFSFFGVHDHTQCVSGAHAGLTYSKYGPSLRCYNGTGGPGAMDVYSFEGSNLLDDTLESFNYHTDNQVLPSEDRSFIYLKPQPVNTQTGTTRNSLLPGALTNALFIKGQVNPVSIEPLFHEVDEFKYGDFMSVPLGTNLLVNPDFEQPLQNSPLMGWSCQGETDDPRGGALSQYSSDHHEGNYSGICYARLAIWAGPGQYIGRKVKSLGVYSFIGWTKLLDAKHTNDIHTLELWLRFKKRDERKEKKMRLARRDLLSADDGWVRWKTAFKMPRAPKGFLYVFIFFKGPRKSVDIVADEMSLIEMYKDPSWKQKTNALIEKYRKRRVKIRVNVPPNVVLPEHMKFMEIKIDQKKRKFGFGAAVNTESFIHNEKYREFFLKNFQWAVMENAMKWPLTEPQKDHFAYGHVEKMLDILEKHNISLRGHCIYWAVEEQIPKWLHSMPKTQLFNRMKLRIDDLLGRYHGRFEHWDVNNEMLHGRFFADRLGKPIREWMFKKAAELDPDADMFLNDFDVVENGQLTELLVEEAKELINRGVDIDGIGVQGHFTGPIDPFLLRLHLNDISEVGRPIWLTEVDVLDKNVHQRADSLETLMRTAFSHPNVNGMILWAFWEKNSWRGPDATIVNSDWKLNPAGQRYFQLLDQWTTRGTVNPTKTDKNGGEVSFSAFHGEYEVTVSLPGGNTAIKKFILDPGEGDVTVTIDVDNHSINLSDFNLVTVDKGFSHLLAKFESQLENLLQRPGLKSDREPDQRLPDP